LLQPRTPFAEATNKATTKTVANNAVIFVVFLSQNKWSLISNKIFGKTRQQRALKLKRCEIMWRGFVRASSCPDP
jgi:hypothetical protein